MKTILGRGAGQPADTAPPPAASYVAPSRAQAPTGARATVVFSGVPAFADGAAVLFDSTEAGATLPPFGATIARLVVRFLSGLPSPGLIDPGLVIQIFVDDLSEPRARVRIADLARQQGERPLNIAWRQGQVLRVVLLDPSGAWAQGAPTLEVALG